MMTAECPFEENTYLSQSATNLTIQALQQLDEHQLVQWADAFCEEVVYAWDTLGIPIIGGQSEDNIIADFKRLLQADPILMERTDELTGKRDCIENTYGFGGTCGQFFPTMLKTKDISSSSLDGPSIYSYFADMAKRPKLLSTLKKLLQRDPFGTYSKPVVGFDDFLQWKSATAETDNIAFWLKPSNSTKDNQLKINKEAVDQLVQHGHLGRHLVAGSEESYVVHTYDASARIMDFPKLWRVIFDGTPATNFAPLIAKYLYQRFAVPCADDEPAVVYDPSAGWGGRILGAMATAGSKRLHYIGTDPNEDHSMPELGQTKYEYLADYYNSNMRTSPKNTYDIFQLGSEVIRHDIEFQQYRGKVDFAFTSPPYFAVEGYSEQATQSHIKFPTYDDWLDGFLRPTLETAEEWLRLGGFLCLNVADIRINRKVLPLQKDTVDILTRLGFGRHPDIKMVLKDSPRGSKQTENGIPTTRNFCKIEGKMRKYEPLLVFQKILDDDIDLSRQAK